MGALHRKWFWAVILLCFFTWVFEVLCVQARQIPIRIDQPLGQFENSEKTLDESLGYYRQHPEDLEVLSRIARLYETQKQYKQAVDYREQFIVKGDASLAGGSIFRDQCDKLLGSWKKIGTSRILLLFKRVSWSPARKHYQAKLTDQETEPRMRVLSEFMLGEIERRRKFTLKGAERRKEAIDQAWSHYCKVLEQTIPPLNEWDQAVNRLLLERFSVYGGSHEALVIYKHQPEERYLVELGQWLRRQGRGYEMLALYEDYLLRDCRVTKTVSPRFDFQPRLNEQVVDALLLVGQGDILVDQLHHLLEENALADVYRDLGYALIQQTRFQEGLEVLASFLASVDPPLASDYAWVGNLCKRVGLIDKAIEYYESALETELTNVERREESMSSSMRAPLNVSGQEYRLKVIETLDQRYRARLKKTLLGLYEHKGQPSVSDGGKADRLSQVRSWAYFARVPVKESARIAQRAKEVLPAQGVVNGPLVDLDALRSQAQTLLGADRDYSGAVALYQKILEKAPTDVKSMVHLAQAYEQMNRLDEATALFERVVFDLDIRRWCAFYYSYDHVAGNLRRIYGQNKNIKKLIRLTAFAPGGSFRDLTDQLRTRDEQDAFHASLMGQWAQTPDNLKLNFYLIHYFAEQGKPQKALDVLNRLHRRLAAQFGPYISIDYANQLAQGYECLTGRGPVGNSEPL